MRHWILKFDNPEFDISYTFGGCYVINFLSVSFLFQIYADMPPRENDDICMLEAERDPDHFSMEQAAQLKGNE